MAYSREAVLAKYAAIEREGQKAFCEDFSITPWVMPESLKQKFNVSLLPNPDSQSAK